MNIDNLEIAIEKIYEVKGIISLEKQKEEDDYYAIPETERDERMYHTINTFDIMKDELDEMINDLNLIIKEQ